jgi:tRNA pseudouridine65 synthase
VDAGNTLPLLYCDEWLVTVDKPSGLLVHRSPIDRHETRFALQLVRDQLGRRVHPVHRLDKGTSGALMFALDPETARALTAAFATREVIKQYRALVRGWPDAGGVIDRPLAAVEDDYLGPSSSEPRVAITRYTRLATYELPVRVDRYPTSRYALLELAPQTGRRHQLRRHLATASHPIVGDSTYGKGRHNRVFAERFGNQRLLLACTRLELAHPRTGRPLVVEAPLAREFASLVETLDAQYAAVVSPPST